MSLLAVLQSLSGFDVGAARSGSPATGILVNAARDRSYQGIVWKDIPGPDGMTITVATDNLKAQPPWADRPIRLPTSWPDTISIARSLSGQLGQPVITASKRIADAIYAAADVKTAFHSLVVPNDPDSGGWKMEYSDFARRYNDDVDAQIAGRDGLVAGHDKYWILHPRLAEKTKATGRPSAINYGGWTAQGAPQQSPGGRHDIDYAGDYSQLFRPVLRYAKAADGSRVDLLDWIRDNESVPEQYVSLFRFDGPAA